MSSLNDLLKTAGAVITAGSLSIAAHTVDIAGTMPVQNLLMSAVFKVATVVEPLFIDASKTPHHAHRSGAHLS